MFVRRKTGDAFTIHEKKTAEQTAIEKTPVNIKMKHKKEIQKARKVISETWI
jgi:hypothetical protein